MMDTLESIFEQTSYEELQEVVVVVHLADFGVAWCKNQVQEINRKFTYYVMAGHLLMAHTSAEYYPKLDSLKRNYNDLDDQVHCCFKQIVDYAYLFNFCANLSHYYIMMEDDVRCVFPFQSNSPFIG